MKWVIRHIPEEMFVVSPRFSVYNSKFARRFRTKKQAEAYMTSSGFDRKDYSAEELQVETDDLKRSNTNNEKE
ncbi:MAG: hypothetical protein IKW96_03570 [Ruminococcus sp.]|uniref:hypothetical protein n=1 Tax=Ruminococcus sp. TaxID=41978 RepID=UPI0025F81C14|nr:hypothetical protein [Ruminococcus sp.]MBR5682349.1 hypothetical protein [Ruminococcus sp.]